jgi:large subunit ribosomal protein L32
MPLPKRRHSNARTRKRRSHDAIKPLSRCPRCQAMTLPHRACRSCGHYRGREVVKQAEE